MSQHEHLAFAPPADPGFGRALLLALLVHFLLLLALTWGVTWRSTPQDDAIEAELWSAIPEPVAQRNEEPAPPTEVKPETPPKPVEPVKPPPPSTAQQALADKAKIEADIAIEKQKKKDALERDRQIELEKKAAKAKEEEVRLKEASAKKAEEEKEKKAAQERENTKRQEEQKRKDDEARAKEEAKRKEEDEAKRLEEESKHKEETAKRKEEEAKRLLEEKKESELRRQEQIKRLKGLGEASTGPTDKASAAKASAPSGTYLGRLRARVRPNITFPESQLQAVKGNPEAEVEVTCSATGEITSKKLIRSSGNTAWDEAVMNAIEKTGTLPRDENGNMPPKISFGFKPRD
ncbi:MAG: cell envelope integrity protein TolA [Burkholderiales bacterium]|nr:cell envelope integrity protein TolA [Burkholderiales bacterium]